MLTTTGIARGIGSHRKAANRQPPTRLSPNANTSSHPRFRFSEPWAHELGRTSQHVNVNFNELLLLTYPRLVPSTPDVDEHSEEEGSVQVRWVRWGLEETHRHEAAPAAPWPAAGTWARCSASRSPRSPAVRTKKKMWSRSSHTIDTIGTKLSGDFAAIQSALEIKRGQLREE
jgi:hypothetical protein